MRRERHSRRRYLHVKLVTKSGFNIMQPNIPNTSTASTAPTAPISSLNRVSTASTIPQQIPQIMQGGGFRPPVFNPWQPPPGVMMQPPPWHFPLHLSFPHFDAVLNGRFPGPITHIQGGNENDIPVIWHALLGQANIIETDLQSYPPRLNRERRMYDACYRARSQGCPPSDSSDLRVHVCVGSDYGQVLNATIHYLTVDRSAVIRSATAQFGGVRIHYPNPWPPQPYQQPFVPQVALPQAPLPQTNPMHTGQAPVSWGMLSQYRLDANSTPDWATALPSNLRSAIDAVLSQATPVPLYLGRGSQSGFLTARVDVSGAQDNLHATLCFQQRTDHSLHLVRIRYTYIDPEKNIKISTTLNESGVASAPATLARNPLLPSDGSTLSQKSGSSHSLLGTRRVDDRSPSPQEQSKTSGSDKRYKSDKAKGERPFRELSPMDVSFYRPTPDKMKAGSVFKPEEAATHNEERIKQARAADHIFPLRQKGHPDQVVKIFASKVDPAACREGMSVSGVRVHEHQYSPLWERITGECKYPKKTQGRPRINARYQKPYTGAKAERDLVRKFIDNKLIPGVKADLQAYFNKQMPPSAQRIEMRVMGRQDIMSHEAGLLNSFGLYAAQASKGEATYLGLYPGMIYTEDEYADLEKEVGEAEAGSYAMTVKGSDSDTTSHVLVPGDAGNWVMRANTALDQHGNYDLQRLNAQFCEVEVTFQVPEDENSENAQEITQNFVVLVGTDYDAGDPILVHYGADYSIKHLVAKGPDSQEPSVKRNTTDSYYHLAPKDTGDGGHLPFHHKKQHNNNCGIGCVETATHGKFQFTDQEFHDILNKAGVLPSDVRPGDGYGMVELAWMLKYHCSTDIRYIGAPFHTPKSNMDSLVDAVNEVRKRDPQHEAKYAELEQRLRALFESDGTLPDHLNADQLKATFANAVDELLQPTMSAQSQVHVDKTWVNKIDRLKDSLHRVFDQIKTGLLAEQNLLNSLDSDKRDFCILHIRRGESYRGVGHYIVWRLNDDGYHYCLDTFDEDQSALSMQAAINHALSQEDNDINGIELIIPSDPTDPLLQLMQTQSPTNQVLHDYGAIQMVYQEDGTGDAGLLSRHVASTTSHAVESSSQDDRSLPELGNLALHETGSMTSQQTFQPPYYGAPPFVPVPNPPQADVYSKPPLAWPSKGQLYPGQNLPARNPFSQQFVSTHDMLSTSTQATDTENQPRPRRHYKKKENYGVFHHFTNLDVPKQPTYTNRDPNNPLHRSLPEQPVPSGVQTITLSEKAGRPVTVTVQDHALLESLKSKEMFKNVNGQLVPFAAHTPEYGNGFARVRTLTAFADYLLRYHGQSLSNFRPANPLDHKQDPRVINFKHAQYKLNNTKNRYSTDYKRRITGDQLPRFLEMRDTGQLAAPSQPGNQGSSQPGSSSQPGNASSSSQPPGAT
jgi:hypothetical protein